MIVRLRSKTPMIDLMKEAISIASSEGRTVDSFGVTLDEFAMYRNEEGWPSGVNKQFISNGKCYLVDIIDNENINETKDYYVFSMKEEE